jgi:type VI secretion system protein ImpJ
MMTTPHTVAWTQGLFLQPQHFQQQAQATVAHASQLWQAHGLDQFGFTELELDPLALTRGEVALKKATGLLPDGTVFKLPNNIDHVSPLTLTEEMLPCTVYLTLPHGNALQQSKVPAANMRHFSVSKQVQDQADSNLDPLDITVSALHFSLKTQKDDIANTTYLPVCHITKMDTQGALEPDESFVPTVLHVSANHYLAGFAEQLLQWMIKRRHSIVQRLQGVAEFGISSIHEVLLLQTINRYEAILSHYCSQKDTHPKTLFTLSVQLLSELCTFTKAERSLTDQPEYQHLDLKASFVPLEAKLRDAFSYVFEAQAISIPLKGFNEGYLVGVITDKTLLRKARFVLAVHDKTPSETLRSRFGSHVKIAPVEKIRDVVNRQVPGITMSVLSQVPRQIPYYSDHVYFVLDQEGPLWQDLSTAAGLGVHLSGLFVGAKVTLWAIKE